MRPRKGLRTKNASTKLTTLRFLQLCLALPAATASPPPLYSRIRLYARRQEKGALLFTSCLYKIKDFLFSCSCLPCQPPRSPQATVSRCPPESHILLWSLLLLHSAFRNYPCRVCLLFSFILLPPTPPPPFMILNGIIFSNSGFPLHII